MVAKQRQSECIFVCPEFLVYSFSRRPVSLVNVPFPSPPPVNVISFVSGLLSLSYNTSLNVQAMCFLTNRAAL